MKWTSPFRASRAVAQNANFVPRWEVQNIIKSLLYGKPMVIVRHGIDLAKNVFAGHSINTTGKETLIRPCVPRAKLVGLVFF
jgi:urocanate hydratase